MSVDQIRAALDTIDATPRPGFLDDLEHHLVSAWGDDALHAGRRGSHDVPVDVDQLAPRRHPGRRWMLAGAAAVVAVTVGVLTVVAAPDPDHVRTVTVPPTPVPSTGPVTAPTRPPVDSVPVATPDVEDPPGAATSGGMWPQSSVDEVREAQARADAGDPAATWQLDPRLGSDEWWSYLRQPGSEIVARFIHEQLGWEEFLFNPYLGDDGDGDLDGILRGVVYLRCAPGAVNPLYPIAPTGHQEAPGADRCAPTIDDTRYETVSIDLTQPGRTGPDGIWVVSEWRMIASFAQVDPAVAEATATARLEAFLDARLAGQGAEGLVDVDGPYVVREVPLLYATTDGAPYERYEVERATDPEWPTGAMEFDVTLLADGGATVVEQRIAWRDGTLAHDERTTTEDGRPLAVRYSVFDDEVAVSAPDPWVVNVESEIVLARNGMFGDEYVELADDPLPVESGCEPGAAPADAAALARSLRSDPDLEVTTPVPTSVAGTAALVMDLTLTSDATVCASNGRPLVLTHATDGWRGQSTLEHGSRMRLYVLDLPDGMATRILAIAVVAPQARFEAVVAAAAPLIESVELRG